ncbi:hypothetical protein Tco_0522330 [Tanacetum coccineum]
MVENLLPPRLRYQEPPYALPETLLAPVTHNDPRDPYVAARDAATAPATDDDITYPKGKHHSEHKDLHLVTLRRQGNNGAEGKGGAPSSREVPFWIHEMQPYGLHGHEGAVEHNKGVVREDGNGF